MQAIPGTLKVDKLIVEKPNIVYKSIASGHADIILTQLDQHCDVVIVHGAPDDDFNILFTPENTRVFVILNNTNYNCTLKDSTGNTVLLASKSVVEILNTGDNILAISGGSTPISTAVRTRKYLVMSAFRENESLNIISGVGDVAGTTVVSGKNISSVGSNSLDFIGTDSTRVRLNGVSLDKGLEVNFNTSSSLTFSLALDIGDYLEIEILN